MIPRSARPSGAALSAEGALRTRGLRSTMPRRVILDVVRATDTHPTAAIVFERVRRRLPRVSLATVYRNLRRLAAEGLLRERVEATGLRFDPNVGPHDHFICVACGRILDLPRRARPHGRANWLRGPRPARRALWPLPQLSAPRRPGALPGTWAEFRRSRPLASRAVRCRTARVL